MDCRVSSPAPCLCLVPVSQLTHENVEEDATAIATENMSSAVYEVRGVGFLRLSLNIAASEVRREAGAPPES